MKDTITTIAFDADDTLWVNEPYFQETEKQFCKLLSAFHPQELISQELFKTEIHNLQLYGYGVKGFVLSMVETANRMANGKVTAETIDQIIEMGKDLLQKPIELLSGVEATLKELQSNYRLIVATKGDLLDQQRKLQKSGLEPYFHHIEIMSNKTEDDYAKLLKHIDCKPENFLMIGNSIKSDILPVLGLGSHAAHIPFHTTWAHEQHEQVPKHNNFMELKQIQEIVEVLK